LPAADTVYPPAAELANWMLLTVIVTAAGIVTVRAAVALAEKGVRNA
jgi:hypothetical protein